MLETCVHGAMPKPQTCVYVIRSLAKPWRYYTGLTGALRARLEQHNEGKCRYTASARPWQLDLAIRFADVDRAVAFERYLKSGSGVAFAKRHLRRADDEE